MTEGQLGFPMGGPHDDAARRFRERANFCLALNSNLLSNQDELWTLNRQRIAISDGLGVHAELTWMLDSSVFKNGLDGGPAQADYMVPLPPAANTASDLLLVTRGTSHTIGVISGASFERMCDGDLYAEGPVPVCVADLPLDALLSFPVLTARIPIPARASVGHKFRFKQLLPVSWIDAHPVGEMPAESIAISFPAYATIDQVLLRCSKNWRKEGFELAEAVEKFRTERSQPGADPLPYSQFLKAHIGMVKAAVSGEVSDLKRATEMADPSKKTRDLIITWGAELDEFLSRLDAALEGIDVAWQTFDDVAEVAARLRDVLTDADTSFTIPCEVGEGYIKTPRALSAPNRNVQIDRVIIPFSTEREPGTQGKRSGLILMLLALLLFLVAYFDRSWMPWMDEKHVGSNDLQRLTEPVIVLLVLFPTVLYGQFFQSRPRSDLGNQAQLGTFALLSLLFALPILPAALLVARVDSAAVSVVVFLCGVITLIAAVFVWWLFRAPRLAALRQATARKLSVAPFVASTRPELPGTVV